MRKRNMRRGRKHEETSISMILQRIRLPEQKERHTSLARNQRWLPNMQALLLDECGGWSRRV